ncbi:MAG: HlyD family type I secretion periplasmic adaptor subunit [Alphaproteobacteria bacterium]|nr:HlyD family type I secretion periplasmic adaptor subunit [Alphaproteobacteria bacterium]
MAHAHEKPATVNTSKSLRRLQFAGFAAIVSMVAVFGVWSWAADINGAVIAPATIQAESYSKKVQHREGGNVLKIMVHDGDVVQEGQDLIELDPTEIKANLGIINGQLDEYLIKRARLEAQRDGRATLELPEELKARADDAHIIEVVAGQQKLLQSTLDTASAKAEQYKVQAGQLEDQIKGLEAQIEGDKKQLDLIAQETDSLRKLQQQGLVPATRVMAMDREAARIGGDQGQLSANIASSQSKISETKLQILQVQEEVRNQALTDLRDTESKLVELQGQKLASQSRLEHLTIKAPITGTVYQLSVHTEGGVIAPNEPLMMILPQNDDLVLQAAVSPNDISHVQVGQPAEIMFTAFDTRVTPKIAAEVTQVAADTTRPDPSKGEAAGQPYYAIRLTIPAKELAKLGSNKLKPGMAAEAFIQTESRSPFSYLIKPLVQQWSHAMRES